MQYMNIVLAKHIHTYICKYLVQTEGHTHAQANETHIDQQETDMQYSGGITGTWYNRYQIYVSGTFMHVVVVKRIRYNWTNTGST